MLRASDVVRLHMGHFIAPAHLPFAGAAVVVDGFLIRHPSGPVLLDTGIGEGMPEVDALYKPVRRELDAVLRDAGVALKDVRVIANCHLHFDHSGNNFRFPGVPIFAQRVEHETALGPSYTFTERAAAFEGARFELIEGEAEIAPGVRIVPTPGHVAGHQSFVIDTQEGRSSTPGVWVAAASRIRRTRRGSLGSRSTTPGASRSRTTSRSGNAAPNDARARRRRARSPLRAPPDGAFRS